MRILVLQPTARQQRAGRDQCVHHAGVGIALVPLVVDDARAVEARNFLGVETVGVHGVGDARVNAALVQQAARRHPDVKVLAAMARRGVHKSGARVVGDMVAVKQRHPERIAQVLERMIAGEAGKFAGRNIAQLFKSLDLGGLQNLFRKLVGEDQFVAGLRPSAFRRGDYTVMAVGDPVRIGDGAVAGKRPGRRRPDHHARRETAHREGDEHPIRRVVLVFHFGFGQRGLLHHRPHHRLGAAIEQAVGGEFQDFGGDDALGGVIHGGVTPVPLAGDAETLEFLALHAQPAFRKSAALLTEFHRGHFVLVATLRPILLLNLPFDRQAVAVPARNVIGVLAAHALRANDDVLQDLVERVADVDVAIGVGRAVMQHEFRFSRARLAHLPSQVGLPPMRQQFRLLLRQAGAHGEIGFRQIKRGGIVGAGFLGHRASRGEEVFSGSQNPGARETKESGANRADNSPDLYGVERHGGLVTKKAAAGKSGGLFLSS